MPKITIKRQSIKKHPFVFSDIPTQALGFLVQLDSFTYIKLRLVSKKYMHQTNQAIDDICNRVENDFVCKYINELFFKRSFTWCKRIAFCGE